VRRLNECCQRFDLVLDLWAMFVVVRVARWWDACLSHRSSCAV